MGLLATSGQVKMMMMMNQHVPFFGNSILFFFFLSFFLNLFLQFILPSSAGFSFLSINPSLENVQYTLSIYNVIINYIYYCELRLVWFVGAHTHVSNPCFLLSILFYLSPMMMMMLLLLLQCIVTVKTSVCLFNLI